MAIENPNNVSISSNIREKLRQPTPTRTPSGEVVYETQESEVSDTLDSPHLHSEVQDIVEDIEDKYPNFWEKGELQNSVEQVSRDLETMLALRNIDPEQAEFVIATDFDGPINIIESDTTPEQIEISPGKINMVPGFSEALSSVPVHPEVYSPAVISNRSLPYLHNWRKTHLDEHNASTTLIGGEGGRTFTKDGFSYDTPAPENLSYDQIFLSSEPELYDIEEALSYESDEKAKFLELLYEEAAEQGLKITQATKLSPELITVSIEGTGTNLGDKRTGIWNNEFYSKEYGESTIEEIWDNLEHLSEEENPFDRYGDIIAYDGSHEAAKLLNEALTYSPSELQFFKIDDRIAFTTNPLANENYTHEEMKQTIDSIAEDYESLTGENVETIHNSDWWSDIVIGEDTTKETATNNLVEHYPGISDSEDVLILYMGDKPTDVFQEDNSIFFAQRNTEVEDYVDKHGMIYPQAENAVDYLLGITDVLKYHK